jgi:hypothetical protein
MSEIETNKILRELLKWTKVTSIPTVKSLLESTLTTPEQKKAYEASNGMNVRDVADIAHVGKSTVGRWWADWVNLGLAELRPAKGGDRAFRLFSLSEFGLDVSEPKRKTKSRGKIASRKAGYQTTVNNAPQFKE